MQERYSYYSYSLWFGIVNRFSDFFDPITFTANCSKSVKVLEGRIFRVLDNYQGKYLNSNSSNQTYYDYIILQGQFIASVMNMSNIIAVNCMYGMQEDVWQSNILQIYTQNIVNIYYFILSNDQYVFEDIVNILDITLLKLFSGSIYILLSNWILNPLMSLLYSIFGDLNLKSYLTSQSSVSKPSNTTKTINIINSPKASINSLWNGLTNL